MKFSDYQERFDCSTRTSAPLRNIRYDAAGRLLSDDSGGHEMWMSIVSLDLEKVAKILCE